MTFFTKNSKGWLAANSNAKQSNKYSPIKAAIKTATQWSKGKPSSEIAFFFTLSAGAGTVPMIMNGVKDVKIQVIKSSDDSLVQEINHVGASYDGRTYNVSRNASSPVKVCFVGKLEAFAAGYDHISFAANNAVVGISDFDSELYKLGRYPAIRSSVYNQVPPVPALSVTTLAFAFLDCTQFNQPLTGWEVVKPFFMDSMFENAASFNQPLNHLDVSRVSSFSSTFSNASSFNQPLSNWNVSAGNSFTAMFYGARSFSQNLLMWVATPSNKTNFSVGSGLTPAMIPPSLR